MKNILPLILIMILPVAVIAQRNIAGAWQYKAGTIETVLIFAPSYFSVTTFDIPNKKFIHTWGGRYSKQDNNVSAVIEFNSLDKAQVGKKINFNAAINNNVLASNIINDHKEWKQIDDNTGALAGLWVITGREQNGVMNKMTPGERKTIKILSGTRFQWAAINTATGDFFGTGGGNYSFQNGIYTENIEFFPRDSTRVGMSLSFNGSVNGDEWDHSGKSSKGDPVHEIWTRLP